MFLFNCRSHHTAACERTAKVRESRIGRREKLDFFRAVAKIALILNEISNIEPREFRMSKYRLWRNLYARASWAKARISVLLPPA
jgi:hypothetical protein